MAHLKTKATTGKPQDREQGKWSVVRGLYERGYKREDIIKLFKVIDRMIALPKELQQSFEEKLTRYEEERRMPLLSNADGRVLRHLHKQGQQVRLVGLKFPVTVCWYYLKREKGRLEKRFVLSTRSLKARAILNGGESADGILVGWFKTANFT